MSWTPPRFDGGAPVLSYVVRGYTGGSLVTSKEVTGLETTMPAAEEYRVAAVNVIGTGPERGEPVLAERIDVSGPDVISEPGASATYPATFTPADTTYKDVTLDGDRAGRRADLQGRDLGERRPAGEPS